jgi:hypothetical protein
MGAFTIGPSLNVGFPGDITRPGTDTFSRQIQSTDANGPAFGHAVILNANNTYSDLATAIAAGTTFTAALFAGIALRIVKSFTSFQAVNGTFQQAGVGQYVPGDFADVITRGTGAVTVQNGTPTAGGPVYVRTAVSGSLAIGGFEANVSGAAPTGTVKLTNAFYTTGVQDANGVSEITIQFPQA